MKICECNCDCDEIATTTDEGLDVCDECSEYAVDEGDVYCSRCPEYIDEGSFTGGGMFGMGTAWVSKPRVIRE